MIAESSMKNRFSKCEIIKATIPNIMTASGAKTPIKAIVKNNNKANMIPSSPYTKTLPKVKSPSIRTNG